MRGGNARERRRIGLKERGPMSAAFVGSLRNSDETGDADAGVDRQAGRVARAGRRGPAARRAPGSISTGSGSEVACGLR
jgi:hypothetical protein